MNKQIQLVFWVLCSMLNSCQAPGIFSDTSETVGLNTPIQLNPGTTSIPMQDYILHPATIDSVQMSHPLFQASLTDANDTLRIVAAPDAPALANLHIWLSDGHTDIMVRKSDKRQVNFTYTPDINVQKVQIKGEMNAWNPNESEFQIHDGQYIYTTILSPGQYQYLLVIDGKEILDPSNPESIDNNLGGRNSIVTVKGAEGEKPILETNCIANNERSLTLTAQDEIDELFIYWQNHRLGNDLVHKTSNEIQIKLPAEAAATERTFIRAYASNKAGISNDILIPIHYGKVLTRAGDIQRTDMHAQVIYFLMVDRFFNGDTTNDFRLNDPEVHPRADYHGGDLAGVVEKLNDGYFDSLGINTIWLSPIVQNPMGKYGLWPEPRSMFSGYHGYWPVSSSKIDFRFGSDSNLHQLVEQAHANNKNIMLDLVANHVHELHPVYQQHPDWATNLYLPDGTLNTEKWDEHRLTTWFDTFLPTLDLANQKVVDVMIDSAYYWLQEFQVDAFRHDATKHIHERFWRSLTKKVKTKYQKPFYQVGETYGSRELINSYIGSGMLNAQFDFNTYDDAVATFCRPEVSLKRLQNSLTETQKYYGIHNQMVYISGNQDRARLISYASGDVRFDENAKMAGWTRDIGVSDTMAYFNVLQLNAFNMTIPGIPCIYYGDEIGLAGGNDPDNRRMMRFDSLSWSEDNLLQLTKKVVQARRSNPCLVYGGFKTLILNDDIWVYQRKYFNQSAVVVLSKQPVGSTISINLGEKLTHSNIRAVLGSNYTIENNTLDLVVGVKGVEILFFNTSL